jgi:formylglycine-generating enzyme required for sulfatase activity
MDKFEVTAGAYQSCIDAGICSQAAQVPGCNAGLDGLEDHPINCVIWSQADTYCQWVGKRLPTEAEWEKAARGTDGRRFPWGEGFPAPELLNYRSIFGGTTPIGTYEAGTSFYGVHNMGGNVAEWTADYYGISPAADPPGPDSGSFRVGRGASWQIGVPVEALTATVRNRFNPETPANSIGFRCARTPSP